EGDGVARGYQGQSAITAERFLPDSFTGCPGARLYWTGDLVKWLANGDLVFLGRIDDQVKISGYRIELAEIEAVLRSHTGIDQAAVLMHEDSSGKRIVAYVTAKKPDIVNSSQLKTFISGQLPEYMVPSAFVIMDALPYTTHGKVDRKALQQYSLGTSISCPVNVVHAYPRDKIVLSLQGVWEEILGINSVGTGENFFDIGGYSLKALVLASRIGEIFDIRIPVRTVFEYPTIADMAAFLRQNASVETVSSVVPIQPKGTARPLFCVHPGDGLTNCFIPLAQCLGSDQPLFAFQAYGIEENELPLRSVEEIAAAYIKDMQRIQPTGPFQLAGMCLGATIAYEIAQQLVASGEPVSFLAILDEFPNLYPVSSLISDSELETTEKDLLALWLEYKFRPKVRISGVERPKEYTLSIDAQLDTFLAALKTSGEVPQEITREQYRRRLQVEAMNVAARKRYRFQPFPGRITVFRSDFVLSFGESIGWKKLAQGGLEIVAVPLEHNKFFINEHSASVLAEILKPRLYRERASEGKRQEAEELSMATRPQNAER